VPICGKDTLPFNPYGKFLIQDASSGRYVAASSANTNLIASAADISGAATFNSSFVPNSGTLQLMSTREFVTADQSGNFTLSATRSIPSSWETFVIRQKIGAAAGVYSIKAASNGLYVTISGDGLLINNGKNEAASSGFKFSNS
jgi:endo-1,3(4)-beta-glucanase